MDCTDLRAILSGLVDGELDAERRHEAERHLVDCEGCRARVSRTEALDLLLRDAADRWGRQQPLPNSVVEGVLSRTVADVRSLHRLRRAALLGWLAAAAAVAISLPVWMDRLGGGGSELDASTNRASSTVEGVGAPLEPVPADTADRNAGGESRWADRPEYQTPETLRSMLLAERSTESDAPPRVSPNPKMDGLVTLALHGPPIWMTMLGGSQPTLDARVEEVSGIPSPPDSELVTALKADELESWIEQLRDNDVFAAVLLDHVDTLVAASQLLRQFHRADLSSPEALEGLRNRIEYDRILERLDAADALLGDLEVHQSIRVAAAMLLRIQRHQEFDRDELRGMKRDLCRIPIIRRLENLADALEVKIQA